jgi:hypothetical protein
MRVFVSVVVGTPGAILEGMTNPTLTKAQRTQIRRIAGATRAGSPPIEVVEGDQAPELVGSSWHYETMGGTYIQHPGAYAKTGWSNMRYVGSTRRVRVGQGWLEANKLILI